MTVDYRKQLSIVNKLLAMPYGNSWAIERHDWRDIVPTVDPMRQLLLASAGHRPETERTPEDWFRFWLNGPSDHDFLVVKTEPYVVGLDGFKGTMKIHLPENQCPRCRGRGIVESYPKLDAPERCRPGSPSTELVTITRTVCDHSKG